jgi:hypothetical protein
MGDGKEILLRRKNRSWKKDYIPEQQNEDTRNYFSFGIVDCVMVITKIRKIS